MGGGLVLAPFSNGGCIPFRFMTRLLNSEQQFEGLRTSVRAVVFDSSPCYMAIVAGARALCFSLGLQNPLSRAAVYVGFPIFCLLTAPWSENTPSSFWKFMQSWNLGPNVLDLYLSSDTDVLLD